MDFNKQWRFYKANEKENVVTVDLPHDAMLEEERDINNPSSISGAYFKGGDYYYEKDFTLPVVEEGGRVLFRFEGVYHNAQYFVNDVKVYERHYGYADFYIDVTDYVKEGNNTIRVFVRNSEQPNSRWYTGSGIIRPVHLIVLKNNHLVPRSVIINTLDYREGKVLIRYQLSNRAPSTISIRYKNKIVVSKSNNKKHIKDTFFIDNPKLWSDETPNLYQLTITVDGENYTYNFGIRQFELDKERGFLLNGKRILLRGCCVHSEAGILGAISHPFVERRKAEILKQAGFNAVRSAHNPISEGFLNACDELGLMVMDEFADSWFIRKTQYDYANYCEEDWDKDITDMVLRDRTHPCIALYSIGNEVGETAFKKGIEWTEMFTKRIKELDKSAIVTCGINVFFNGIAKTPFSQYSDKKAAKEVKDSKPKKIKEGGSSAFFNNLAGIFGSEFMKIGAMLPIVDKNTKEAFSKLDVAGYNYGLYRYKGDLKKYPDRFICGTETFISDAGKFYNIWKDNPRLIGDFIWAGMDYMGEVGIGAMLSVEKKDYRLDKSGWLTASTGAIDILGNPSPQLDAVMVGFRNKISAIAVVSPQEYRKKHSPSAWRFTNAIASWNFPGYIDKKCEVQIYSNAHRVELFQNDSLIFKKIVPSNTHLKCVTKYYPGILRLVSYDIEGNVIDETSLKSGKESNHIALTCEKPSITLDEFAYIHILSLDENNIIDPINEKKVKVKDVINGELLGLGSGIPYCKEGYKVKETETYYGRALAIIKPISNNPIKLILESEFGETEISIDVKD